jgi:hypothetical protein
MGLKTTLLNSPLNNGKNNKVPTNESIKVIIYESESLPYCDVWNVQFRRYFSNGCT